MFLCEHQDKTYPDYTRENKYPAKGFYKRTCVSHHHSGEKHISDKIGLLLFAFFLISSKKGVNITGLLPQCITFCLVIHTCEKLNEKTCAFIKFGKVEKHVNSILRAKLDNDPVHLKSDRFSILFM